MALLIFPTDYPIQHFEPSLSGGVYFSLVFCFYIILIALEVYYNKIIRTKNEEIIKLKNAATKAAD